MPDYQVTVKADVVVDSRPTEAWALALLVDALHTAYLHRTDEGALRPEDGVQVKIKRVKGGP